jgi:hypothetical protein
MAGLGAGLTGLGIGLAGLGTRREGVAPWMLPRWAPAWELVSTGLYGVGPSPARRGAGLAGAAAGLPVVTQAPDGNWLLLRDAHHRKTRFSLLQQP